MYPLSAGFVAYLLLTGILLPIAPWYTGIFLLSVWALPKYKRELLAAANMTCGLLGQMVGMNVRSTNSYLPWRLELALVYLLVLLFYYLFSVFSIRIPRLQAIGILIGSVLACSIFYFVAPPIFKIFTVFLINGVFYNSFYVRTRKSRADITLIGFLSNQQPFFAPNVVPIPPLLGDLITKPCSPEDRPLLQLQALKLLATSCVILFLFNAAPSYLATHFPQIVSGDFPLSHPLSQPLEVFMLQNKHLSAPTLWLCLFGITLFLFMRFTIQFAIPIATVRMLGVSLKNPVYDLFGARTVYQFFERFNPYYCNMMLDFFIYPVYRSFTFLKNERIKRIASFLVGIFLCGIIAHHFVMISFVENGYQPSYPLFATTLVFSALFAGVTGLSMIFERRFLQKLNSRSSMVIRWFLCFAITSIVILFSQGYWESQVALSERFRLFAALFGLS